MIEGLITPEQALKLLETPSVLSPAGRLDLIMELLEPSWDPSFED